MSGLWRGGIGLLLLVWVAAMVAGLALSQEKARAVKERRERLAVEQSRTERLCVEQAALEEHVQGLHSDPVAVEEAVRRKLHWTRPDELVIGWREDAPGLDLLEGEEP